MLLEAMIAVAIIVLCLFPLLTPHVAMYQAEQQFIRKVDLDHVVNQLYASVIEKLYLNQIGWNELMLNQFPVTKEELQKFGYSTLLNYEGSYNFNEVPPRFKPRDINAPYSLYLVTLTLNFIPTELQMKSDEEKRAKTVKYQYEIFLVRDRRQDDEK